MRLDDDFDEEYDDPLTYRSGHRKSTRSAVIIAALFILMTVAIVILANGTSGKKKQTRSDGTVQGTPAAQADWAPKTDVDSVIRGGGTAEDLDFWDAYPTEAPAQVAMSANEASSPTPTPWAGAENAAAGTPSVSEDGAHTRIRYEDGTEEWVDINPYLALNRYDFTGLVYRKPFMQYYENNTKKSFVGVDISKEEDYVDFKLLKRAGVDYVMLRIGQRGYTTGELSVDESFADNYSRAREAGLDVGAYFVTAAISTEEAKEEADFCLQTLSENEAVLDYPLALSTKQLGSGKARTDEVEKMPRTNFALTFMKAVENAGLFSLLYGDKATLIKKYSLGSMIGYDIWYAEEGDLPDYPYQFVMWQYDLGAEVDGIAGGAHLNVCFMDYKVR
ncbi:MAG: hypothetical protein K6E50_10170 [Lachnospiraceae bacterium]|nr:hypothetical protein [Lachnospiraceae bacterium]